MTVSKLPEATSSVTSGPDRIYRCVACIVYRLSLLPDALWITGTMTAARAAVPGRPIFAPLPR